MRCCTSTCRLSISTLLENFHSELDVIESDFFFFDKFIMISPLKSDTRGSPWHQLLSLSVIFLRSKASSVCARSITAVYDESSYPRLFRVD